VGIGVSEREDGGERMRRVRTGMKESEESENGDERERTQE